MFNCLETDIRLDSIWVVTANCDLYNTGGCQPGIRYHTVATNIGTDTIYSWEFSWIGPDGLISTSIEQGINNPNPGYNAPLPPGQSTNVMNSFNPTLVWEEGEELCAAVNILNQQEDIVGNNISCVELPAYPECIEGCLDPCASNYNPGATCDDECLYEPTLIDTVYVNIIDTIYIELPPDTIYIETIDTLYIELPPVVDTLYVQLPPDTITEYIQITDTLEIEIIEYVYLTDTITEIQLVDCNTGLPCEEPPGMDDCWPWTVYIPNVMTPNNDNINDVWKVILDLGCWTQIEFKVYNRWGGLVFEGWGDDYLSLIHI